MRLTDISDEVLAEAIPPTPFQQPGQAAPAPGAPPAPGTPPQPIQPSPADIAAAAKQKIDAKKQIQDQIRQTQKQLQDLQRQLSELG